MTVMHPDPYAEAGVMPRIPAAIDAMAATVSRASQRRGTFMVSPFLNRRMARAMPKRAILISIRSAG